MKISIIIPVRNEETSIRILLESQMNQTLNPAEIVITDCGSTDRTPVIISEYLETEVPVFRRRDATRIGHLKLQWTHYRSL